MEVKFQYIADLERFKFEKPYRINDIELSADDDLQITNIDFEIHTATLEDLRGMSSRPNLEECGFQYIEFPTQTVPGFDDESIMTYANESIELLHQHVRADKVICYDLRLRKHSLAQLKPRTATDRSIPDEPIEAVHIDHTRDEGWSRVAHHLTPEEREKLFNSKWHIRIYNIWKPLNMVVKDMPLAICDQRTVSENDLIAVDQIGPGFNAEIYYVRPSSNHKWYWMRDQKSNEALLFQSWDSHPPGGRVNFCPHVAFQDPKPAADVTLRESVEVRLISFTQMD